MAAISTLIGAIYGRCLSGTVPGVFGVFFQCHMETEDGCFVILSWCSGTIVLYRQLAHQWNFLLREYLLLLRLSSEYCTRLYFDYRLKHSLRVRMQQVVYEFIFCMDLMGLPVVSLTSSYHHRDQEYFSIFFSTPHRMKMGSHSELHTWYNVLCPQLAISGTFFYWSIVTVRLEWVLYKALLWFASKLKTRISIVQQVFMNLMSTGRLTDIHLSSSWRGLSWRNDSYLLSCHLQGRWVLILGW
jgi:hypothetical protein